MSYLRHYNKSFISKTLIIITFLIVFSVTWFSYSHAQDFNSQRQQFPAQRNFPKGSVIFFHPDGTGLNHWNAARMYFKGPNGTLNWDRLPNMAVYLGHMKNNLTGTSNGGATTHAFGYKVDGLGSFGKDGDGNANPPTDKFIKSLSGYPGSIAREAANAGIPVGIVNDGHIAEPGTGAFLAEVGNRDNWQEITRQMIMGREGFNDVAPWVIMGGGEADTRPQGSTLLHRNVNQKRGQPVNSQTSLRNDNLDLEDFWNRQGSGDLSNNPLNQDDWIVIKTRTDFETLKNALRRYPNYAPRVLGIFAYHDMFNDRNEEDLISRGLVLNNTPNYIGPNKESRLALWGDPDPSKPGYNPPTFAEMVEVAIEVLDRAAKKTNHKRFFLVAEQEANDNFGNNNNAIGVLQAMRDTDNAIGIALNYLEKNPHTLILTAADSDAGGMQVFTPYRDTVTNDAGLINLSPTQFRDFRSNPSFGLPHIENIPDGLEGRGTTSTNPSLGAKMFLSEPDQFGQKMEFAISWAGRADYAGGILSRAAGLNAHLLNSSLFKGRLDNIDIYRMMYLTLFGELLDYPMGRTAPIR
jgi:alkaline phosphatase